MLSWLANSDEHFVNNPAASSRPVVALICGGAIFEIIKFTPQNQYFFFGGRTYTMIYIIPALLRKFGWG
jgi:hypothetical protein